MKKILKLLEILDTHSFHSCQAHNPLTTLYCSIARVQRSNEVPLSDEMLTMLLCQWAVTPHRSGNHRPLVVARILCQRQSEIIKVHMTLYSCLGFVNYCLTRGDVIFMALVIITIVTGSWSLSLL